MKQLHKLSLRGGVLADHATQRLKRLKKACFACGQQFLTYQAYDYCSPCSLNKSRYIPGRFKPNLCPECGDGSGWIKFPQQPIRACKLCSLQPKIVQKEINRG